MTYSISLHIIELAIFAFFIYLLIRLLVFKKEIQEFERTVNLSYKAFSGFLDRAGVEKESKYDCIQIFKQEFEKQVK